MKVKIWTERWGNNKYEIITCTVEGKGPVALAGGMQGYLIAAPGGRTFVAETSTGGIIARNVEEARAEIKKATVGAIQDALKDIKKKIKDAVAVTPKEFWKEL